MYSTRLVWSLVAASFVAFVMQEASARLTLTSGLSFGQAIVAHFDSTGEYWSRSSHSVPRVAHAAVLLVLIGNTAYEANCLVGAVAALFVLYEEVLWFRMAAAIGSGAITAALLVLMPVCCGDGSVDLLGQALGVVVLLMTAVFAAAATQVELSGRDFVLDLVPSIPSGAAETVVAMIGTTAVPFNIFLAASLTQSSGSSSGGSDDSGSYDPRGSAPLTAVPVPQPQTTQERVREMQVGIGLASVMTAVVSSLVMIVGKGIAPEDPAFEFTVETIADSLGAQVDEVAKLLFGVGLYAAALSSALSVALGAALTAQQVYSREHEEHEQQQQQQQQQRDGGGLAAVLLNEPMPPVPGSPQGGAGGSGRTSSTTQVTPQQQRVQAGVLFGAGLNHKCTSLGNRYLDVSDGTWEAIARTQGQATGSGDNYDGGHDGNGGTVGSGGGGGNACCYFPCCFCDGGSSSNNNRVDPHSHRRYYLRFDGAGGADGGAGGAQAQAALPPWHARGPLFRAVILGMLLISTAVAASASGAATTGVIVMAQVINGLLLPFLAACLTLCVNDPALLTDPTQLPSAGANCLLLAAAMVTVFLATHLFVEYVLQWAGRGADAAPWAEVAVAGAAAVCVGGALAVKVHQVRGEMRGRLWRRRGTAA